jgi:L-aminopeptidase/D-esterase-like protein
MITSITDVHGILVGQAQNEEALTGCTVIICEEGAVGGVDQRGGSPGTRESDLLRPVHLVEKVHAVVLSGGSAFGLDSASGVVRYLEEKGIGFNTGVARVPIVPGAILFDLAVGDSSVRPSPEMGYQACLNSSSNKPLEGNYGAGAGATIGKILGMGQAMKSGIGTASVTVGNGVIIGAIMAVNAFGDVIDPIKSEIIAGVRGIKKGPIKIGEGIFADTLKVMEGFIGQTILRFASSQNTVIGVVATNARLTKEQANKVAQMGQCGLARTIRPANTMFDGDTIFVMATGQKKVDVNIVGAFAAQAVEEAILRGVKNAKSTGGLPGFEDIYTWQ